jgi:catechol 2,3-dioxygenase-like lactoylglutathione lyase family enzyme
VFDHVTIRVSDREASARLYEAVLRTLGIDEFRATGEYTDWGEFSLAQATIENPVTRRLHIAFFAPSLEHVHEFSRVGQQAGFRDDGAPGPRPQYSDSYYGAFLLDPDGNSAEAVHHDGARAAGRIDHLWIRVADVGASAAFYELVAPFSGFRRAWENDDPPRVGFASGTSSFSLVRDGLPTEHVHVAFGASEDTTVDAFHRAAIEAGHRDHGAPGERTIYHPGYYAAFVLDPDGNNVEVVNHNRV